MIEWVFNNWTLLIGIILLLMGVVLWLSLCNHHKRIGTTEWHVEGNTIIVGQVEIPAKTEGWHELLQEELARLIDGVILFNPPRIMKVGVTERIETRISREIYTNLGKSLKGSGFPQVEKIKISELMKVRLAGKDFDLVSLNEEQQIIPEKGFTEWAWDVTPQNSGMKNLNLQVTLRIRLTFGEEKKDYPVIDREIYVQVNPIYSIKLFFIKYWQWIATTMLLPFAAWAWEVYSK